MYEPGTVLAGKYRVVRTIGRGGMGHVLEAEHVDLRTKVALKLLAEQYVERPHVVERFLREARACAILRSDHVCRVFDVGRFDDGQPYMVLELLEGFDLARMLRASGPFAAATAADYIAQACDAIGEAHAAGIVHRDLKPSNLFVTQRRDGSALVKVLDFGVAKAQGEGDFSLTATDNVVGSPNYMAPEQLRSAKAADARSDIWSLGVILHELVCGRPPFSGETLVDLAVRISSHPPELPTGVPPTYAAIVARCLQKDPALRFQTIGELVAALQPLARASTPTLPPLAIPIPPTPEPPTTLRSASGAAEALPALRRRRLLVIGSVAAILLGISAAFLVGSSHDSVPASPPPSPSPSPPPPPPPPPSPSPSPPPSPPPPPSAAPAPAPVPVAAPAPAPAPAPVPVPAPAPTHPKPSPKKHHPPKDDVGASRF